MIQILYINEIRNISSDEWEKIFSSLGLEKKIREAANVVIKPNLAAGSYVDAKTHVVSDLSLLASIIQYIMTINSQCVIYIAESDSTGYGLAYLKFEHLNLPYALQLAEEHLSRVKMLDLSRDRLKKIENNNFMVYKNIDKQLWLSEILMNADFVVSLSNLKTHTVTGYTGACKNLFGCLPDMDKSHNHPRIHEVIHDLVIAIRPTLSVIDAFYGMEENGPVNGKAVDSGYRVFSDNPIEADIYASRTIGLNPMKIRYLKRLSLTENFVYTPKVKVVRKYQKPGLFVRIMNSVGLFIQRCGQGIAGFGHRIHSCTTLFSLIITIARPILLKVFNYDSLKKWKRKLMK